MTIRRKPIAGNRKGRLHPPLQPYLEAQQAMERGREAVNHVFEHAADEVKEEIARAQAVFFQAENQLSKDERKVQRVMEACKSAAEAAYGKTVEAAQEGEAAAENTVNAMMEKLNRITEMLSSVQPPSPREQR